MSVIVRPIEIQDYSEWLALWNAYLTFYRTTLPEEISRVTFERLTGPDKSINCLVAVNTTQRLVGIAHYLFHTTTWAIDPTCYLQDLFVTPNARGQGLGRLLMQAVYDAAEQHGTCSIHWLTEHDNIQARVLYDEVGTATKFIRYKRQACNKPKQT